jgi:hypothetical protein
MSNYPGNNKAVKDDQPRPGGGIPGRGGGPMQRPVEKAKNPKQALERLLPYLKPFTLPLIGVMVCVVVYTLLGLVGPYLMGLAIDRFINNKDIPGLLNLALLMLLTYFLFNVFNAVANWVMARVSQRALKALRRDLFKHLQDLSIRFFDTHTAGELMSRLTNDIDAKRHLAGGECPVAGWHRDRDVPARSLAGAGDTADCADHGVLHQLHRPVYP